MHNQRSPTMFIDNSEDEVCQLCEKQVKCKDYPGIIYKALARKYCTNLNQFYYVKDVNKVISNSRSKATLDFFEWQMDKEGQECLKRFYSHEDLGWKLERIADFYKDEPMRPKVYIKEVSSVLRRFHYYMDRLRTGNKPIITDTEASDTQIVYSEVDHKDGRAPASNILQTSNRILSGIDRSEGGLSRYSKDFGDLSSVTQQNVVYHQSRIYFNMLEKRKESNEICLLLTQPHALRPEVPVVISHSARMKPEALKKSGSSHPNNSTNTHLYNATFSESCKESAHQPVSKRNNPSGYSAALRSDDKVQQSYVCSKKAKNSQICQFSIAEHGQAIGYCDKGHAQACEAKITTDQDHGLNENNNCRHKRCNSGENIGCFQINEKKNMKNKLPAKKVFDPNWLKSAMKSKRTIQCTSSKKKNPKLRSNDKPEHLSLKLKSSLTCKLLPKFMLNSKNQPGGTDRSKSKNKLKEQSRRSQSISAKKNINMTCKSHKLIEHNTQSGLVSHILIPKSSRSGRGLSSSRRDRPASYSKDYLKPRIRPAHGSSCNFLKPNYSVNASSKRFLQPTSMLYSSNITNRKREFSKSLHEKVLSKLSNNHERLSSHGLHPADWGQFNLEVFKENWKKNKKAQVTHVAANRSNSRLDVMQTLSHRRNISSLSKRSRSDAEQKDNRSKRHSKSRYQTSTSRPVLTLMNQMKADISRLRQSLAVDRWKHPRQKASPPSTKKSSFIKNTRS